MNNITTTRYDIGAEVLSILTRGMYPDPKDALREYIQNGVDANANKINIYIRKNTITIDDNGKGMDLKTLRKAARVGVSEKSPGKDVGFMGIGIYSSFHLCDELTIYSKHENSKACCLIMDFKQMKEFLESQKEKRLNKEISSDELIDLQSLLEKYILIDDIEDSEFPNIGTRVELNGLNVEFLAEFSDFDILSEYLKEVIPLEFDKENFTWANIIEKKINQICHKYREKFELVKVFLQVNNRSEYLYRSYKDQEFHNNKSYEPVFEELINEDEFFGVIWGCLNSTRNKIANKDLRGFLIKKQGFAISNRQKLSPYLRQAYYDRYIGEVIIVNSKILPNAARNDFAYSNKRTILYKLIATAFETYNDKAHEVQEFTLGDEQLDDCTKQLKDINNQFSLYTKDANKLVDVIVEIRRIKKIIFDRLERGSIRRERVKDADKFIKASNEIESTIQATINTLTEQSNKITKKQKEAPKRVSKELDSIKTTTSNESNFNSLNTLIESLDIPLTNDLKVLFNLIDERIIQALSSNEKHYFSLLTEIKEEFEKLN